MRNNLERMNINIALAVVVLIAAVIGFFVPEYELYCGIVAVACALLAFFLTAPSRRTGRKQSGRKDRERSRD